ncbi:U3 small nucleolar ribonucleoprotein protein MPP10-like [Mytilus trossulus]|uniref:U3 small nucleolar ribonucleoprotein protein MPP10-like n=1 Tax=Mytilus trossulus TaxID=6551 RepID=UPI003006278D
MDHRSLTTALKEFSSLTSKPEDFLSCNNKSHDRFKTSTKLIYDFCKNCENNRLQDLALPELIIKHFDNEQIWQELELQNNSLVDNLLGNVAGLLTGKQSVNFLTKDNEVRKENEKPKKKVKSLVNDVEEDESDDTDEEIGKIKSRLEDSEDEIDEGDESDEDFDFDAINPLQNDEDESVDKKDAHIDTDSDSDKKKKKKSFGKKSGKGSIVDDQFFKLAEMEEFLEQEDAKEIRRQKREEKGDDKDEDNSSEDEDIDMFANLSSDDQEGEVKYKDFFDPPDGVKSEKKVKFQKIKSKTTDDENVEGDEEEEESDENSNEDDEQTTHKSGLFDSDSEGEDVNDVLGRAKPQDKSSYEKRQEKLKEKIKKMEEASLGDKTWQLKGETTGTARPENSLLEEHLMFDHIAKIPKVITEEITETLESLIKRRIKDKAWDDVERKIKPKENPFEYKKRITLDQEKSKQSLGEIYEQEYLKQQQKEEEEKTDQDHEAIKKMMQSLFIKLDALSNFHYTPKPAAPEIKIVSNMPTISMEEVAPVSVSENVILAPEEIKEKMKGELKATTEKSETDKKRERRTKKNMKKKKRKEKNQREKLIEKLNPGLGNRYSKEKAQKELEKQSKSGKGVTMIKNHDKSKKKSSLTSSKSFFTQLQEEVTTQIKSKKAEKRRNENSGTIASKKLKL